MRSCRSGGRCGGGELEAQGAGPWRVAEIARRREQGHAELVEAHHGELHGRTEEGAAEQGRE